MQPESATVDRVALERGAVEALSRAQHEPDWLLRLRLEALEAFERMPLPTQQTEGWRRTSLSGLPLDGLVARTAAPAAPVSAYVFDLWQALAEPRLAQLIERHFGQLVRPAADKFTALHYAAFSAATLVVVPRNTVVAEPIWLEPAASSHTLVILEEGAEATVVEDLRGHAPIATAVVEQVLGANAQLRYVALQRFDPAATWSFSTQRAELSQDAHLRTLNLALGARLARNTVQIALNGRGGQADLLGVVGTAGRQHTDFQTLQDHFGDATRSDLVIHNALREQSSANFTGLIRINPSAHQTESSQEQKNILLSPRAKADSDPKLEILNNDVIRCTHGAAVGPVDPEMLFYLESRGLDQPSAERLIVEGFFQSVLARLELPSLQDRLWSAVAAVLDREGDPA